MSKYQYCYYYNKIIIFVFASLFNTLCGTLYTFSPGIPCDFQGMKLTSEEFNAIFTFYDKVRGRTVVGWKRTEEAPSEAPPPRMAPPGP